jgi:hypothetical protein
MDCEQTSLSSTPGIECKLGGAVYKHSTCATQSEFEKSVPKVFCGLDCSAIHAFIDHEIAVYTTAPGLGELQFVSAIVRSAQVCRHVKCACCCVEYKDMNHIEPQRGTGIGLYGQFIDGHCFCPDCFRYYCGVSRPNKQCQMICAPGTSDVFKRDDLKCIRHIGRGWTEGNKPAVGACTQCQKWVGLYKAKDGCVHEYVDSAGNQQVDMIHYACALKK